MESDMSLSNVMLSLLKKVMRNMWIDRRVKKGLIVQGKSSNEEKHALSSSAISISF